MSVAPNTLFFLTLAQHSRSATRQGTYPSSASPTTSSQQPPSANLLASLFSSLLNHPLLLPLSYFQNVSMRFIRFRGQQLQPSAATQRTWYPNGYMYGVNPQFTRVQVLESLTLQQRCEVYGMIQSQNHSHLPRLNEQDIENLLSGPQHRLSSPCLIETQSDFLEIRKSYRGLNDMELLGDD
ncbi:hypothetical protein B0T25DRAFT_195615 [Lasiosphaeria hispida]|uniref:Uncharacterized protein n=1 Tax=Lasiosphaeria hispida TaxID=260671 RepID=A0AAJ0HI73_9PEZI|nr:hypothetical protein B0T25DRAFT_195615 [Lasiosphaeria hispida]